MLDVGGTFQQRIKDEKGKPFFGGVSRWPVDREALSFRLDQVVSAGDRRNYPSVVVFCNFVKDCMFVNEHVETCTKIPLGFLDSTPLYLSFGYGRNNHTNCVV